MFMFKKTLAMPSATEALPGRNKPIPTAREHFIFHRPLKGPYPPGLESAMFGMGCFWGAERKFWELEQGIHITAVGYAAGLTPNPTYEEVCTGRTGHNEVVLVVYDPRETSYQRLLKTFWENHDPTQGMRQGNDVGTQYRSGIYVFTPEQRRAAEAIKGDVRQGAGATPFGADHDRDPGRADLLLRRRLSSAVPGQESGGLLWPRRHRGELPDRSCGQGYLIRDGLMPPTAEGAFVIPLAKAGAAECARIGPKAANLAMLARAGLHDTWRFFSHLRCLSGANRGPSA